MIYGALACLFIGAVFGALWLTSHIGSGWPPRGRDGKATAYVSSNDAALAAKLSVLIGEHEG